jgi:predicted nucleic-acid-binding protein
VRALDTNVVVRILDNDDQRQANVARKLVVEHEVLVPITVIIETEWVLRSGYGPSPAQIATSLRRLGGLPRVTVAEAVGVAQAIDWLEQGMDFADALHLARTTRCDAFVTSTASSPNVRLRSAHRRSKCLEGGQVRRNPVTFAPQTPGIPAFTRN